MKTSEVRTEEYRRFKRLLGRVLAAPHSAIVQREEEYQSQLHFSG